MNFWVILKWKTQLLSYILVFTALASTIDLIADENAKNKTGETSKIIPFQILKEKKDLSSRTIYSHSLSLSNKAFNNNSPSKSALEKKFSSKSNQLSSKKTKEKISQPTCQEERKTSALKVEEELEKMRKITSIEDYGLPPDLTGSFKKENPRESSNHGGNTVPNKDAVLLKRETQHPKFVSKPDYVLETHF